MNPSAKTAPAEKPVSWLARQPILSKDEKVLGYELLFGESAEEERFSSDFDGGTRSIIDALNIMGLDVVCHGRRAFINCTHDMLLKEFFLLLPAEQAVLEIQETVPVDEEVIKACQQLKLGGTASRSTISCLATPKCTLIAQKVETRLQFLTAVKDGFTLFQGYFFHHPERMRARHIPANQASPLRLLQAVSAPEVDLDAVEEMIKQDASLCYRLLHYLNSPTLGVSATVHSVRHGITLLGE